MCQTAANRIDILQAKQQNIPKLMYGDNPTNPLIDITKILKRTIPPSFTRENYATPKRLQQKQGYKHLRQQ